MVFLNLEPRFHADGNAAESRGVAANPQGLDARKSGVELVAVR